MKITYKDIQNAFLKLRRLDKTIPGEVLEFMKNAAIEKLQHNLPNVPRGTSLKTDTMNPIAIP